ncbi:family 10 glycosylhydrolase [Catellatospora sp. KI3]|uniref:glycoside hydrolase family 10 protein n=1 Tax=Catellatospora sp. KI3 TaxID=3041620 RepID=UPI002482EE81|nr:family 10 glycosylhydrolase [Catellatospora sp. KI3]MDI1463450.1 family 10 glycosylhydrolase [Catellatospora sp. KI3]
MIDAINPSSRAAGVLALYTPEFGAETRTNAFGGEAVLRATADRGVYEVVSVCTVFDRCPAPGNNPIPADGAVLSASPPAAGGGDDRRFLRDHLRAGQQVRLDNLLIRTVSSAVDAVDPTAGTNPPGVDQTKGVCFPGCRGAEQLIAYTTASGRPSTQTNDYGYEVVVTDGRVSARGGNNRAIPAGGMVLSGHGSRGSWLETNAVIGAAVTLTGDTVTVAIDAQAYLSEADAQLASARTALAQARESCAAIDAAAVEQALDRAGQLRSQAAAAQQPQDAAELARSAGHQAAIAAYRTRPARAAEGRGLWVRPTETTPAQISAALDRIADAGVNIVFLETVWNGYTIYPSAVAAADGLPAQKPEFAGFDPLRIWVQQAHQRGIELHAWVHTFYVGIAAGGAPVLSAHPDWAAVEREDVGKTGPQPSRMEPGYYWMDPAIPAVRDHVKAVFSEILTGYAVDGLHLDYIRYPVSQPFGADFSYSDYSRQRFAAEHGTDPYTLDPQSPLWETWNRWREARITSFVADVREMQQQVAPAAKLSAAVFADPTDGLNKKFQNWGAWVDAGRLDFLTGMSFGTSADSVGADTAVMRHRVGDVPLYTATYGPLRGSTPDLMLDQMSAVVDADSDGAALFAYNQLSALQAEALREGQQRNHVPVPHADYPAAARAGLADAAASIGSARACISLADAAAITTRLSAARLLLDQPADARLDAAARLLDQAVERLTAAGAEPGFTERLRRDLTMYQRWLRLAHHAR